MLATDLSTKMVEGANRRIQDCCFGNVQARVLDAMTMEGVEEESMDVVTFVGLLETIPDLPRLFRNMAAVLKPGGIVAGTTSNGNCPWYGLRALLHRGKLMPAPAITSPAASCMRSRPPPASGRRG
ncbi:class I SAM-dependent methyltransferase [Fundidesulfovibrio agrisoli]|uniref:class I SAM-dependent methyltransferase n=1 Tax=Fundidesulfovibrio agrisoli TaxID=2922717 RepID=UPI001FADB312